MKKITLLTMLFSLFSVLAFAQNDLRLFSMENAQSQNPTFKCLNRHAPSAINTMMKAEGELVTPPATAQVETWYTTDGKLFVNGPTGVGTDHKCSYRWFRHLHPGLVLLF